VPNLKTIRDRLWHYLEPNVASSIGLTLEDMKQVLTGTRSLQPWQIQALARRMGLA
jgi:hypothetical protein